MTLLPIQHLSHIYKSVIEDKYDTNDFRIASNVFYKNQIEPYLMEYNPDNLFSIS